MSVPKPAVSLDGACSVIYGNTLYTYSANAFQAIELGEGAEWQTLGMGVPVVDGVCVGSNPSDASQAGLFIVGGTREGGDPMTGAPDGCNGEYQGLQKYTYATKTWETLCPQSGGHAVTQSRKLHAATYLKNTDSILIYAGRQDGVWAASSQTYTMAASAPYGAQSWESSAPPAISPILLPWDNGSAAMIGGDESNKKVMVFGNGWVDSSATMADPLPARFKAVLVQGDDGSRNVYTFDLTQSPNVVNRIVIVDGNGVPVANAPTLTARHADSVLGLAAPLRARGLTAADWPAYNSTLAPTTVRSNSAVAQGSDGQVVFVGGNDDDVMCIFNTRENSWQDVASTFEGQVQKVLVSTTANPSSTSTAAATKSATTETAATATGTGASPTGAATSATSAASSDDVEPAKPAVILGAAFGSIIGFALVLGLILLLLRRCHNRKQAAAAGRAHRAANAASAEKGGRGFSDEPMLLPPAAQFRRHNPQGSQSTVTSMGIMTGRAGGKVEKVEGSREGGGIGRKLSNSSTKSATSSIFNQEFKDAIGGPIAGHPASPAPAYDGAKGVFFAAEASPPQRRPPRPSQTAGSDEMIRRSSGWNRYWSAGSELDDGGANESGRSSRAASSLYTDAANSRLTQDSGALPAYFERRPELNHVNRGSPTFSQYPPGTLREGMSGTIERPTSSGSDGGNGAHLAADPAARDSLAESWPTVPKPWFPGHQHQRSGGSAAPPPTPPTDRTPPARPPPSRPLYSGISQQPPLAEAERSSDMSWLNLGGHSPSHPNQI